jgi:hypothetical protein
MVKCCDENVWPLFRCGIESSGARFEQAHRVEAAGYRKSDSLESYLFPDNFLDPGERAHPEI